MNYGQRIDTETPMMRDRSFGPDVAVGGGSLSQKSLWPDDLIDKIMGRKEIKVMQVGDLPTYDIFIIPDGRLYYVDSYTRSDGNAQVICLGKRVHNGNIQLLRHPVSVSCHKQVHCIGLSSIDMRADHAKMNYPFVSSLRGGAGTPIGKLKIDDIFTTNDGRLFFVNMSSWSGSTTAVIECLGHYRANGSVSLLRHRYGTNIDKSVGCKRLARIDMQASWFALSHPLPMPPLDFVNL